VAHKNTHGLGKEVVVSLVCDRRRDQEDGGRLYNGDLPGKGTQVGVRLFGSGPNNEIRAIYASNCTKNHGRRKTTFHSSSSTR
jgi:hypothetical protein